MKLREFIEKLGQFDPEISVCIADWTENFNYPSEAQGEIVGLRSDGYSDSNCDVINDAVFLCIGRNWRKDNSANRSGQ